MTEQPLDFDVDDKQNSIKVSKTSAGKYSFDVKIYFNTEDPDCIVDKIDGIYAMLGERFKNPQNV